MPRTPEDAQRLAVRNLLRGYRLRIPTGQAVARALEIEPLTPEQIEAAAGSDEQRQALQEGGFSDRTPLWYYILAEAKHAAEGQRLGPIGSTIVVEVLVGLVRRSDDSILRSPGWRPSLPQKSLGRFELADLLRFAGVLDETPTVRTYRVRRGDSLARIAERELGDEGRWVEIFVLNRAVIRHPNRIFPGQVLVLPGDTPMEPRPRIYVVRRGDTLARIAQRELGDDDRWPRDLRPERGCAHQSQSDLSGSGPRLAGLTGAEAGRVMSVAAAVAGRAPGATLGATAKLALLRAESRSRWCDSSGLAQSPEPLSRGGAILCARRPRAVHDYWRS